MGKSENETIIRWDETDNPAIIYSCSYPYIKRMERLQEQGVITLKRDLGDGKEWYCPKKLINVRKKRVNNDTPEQREAKAENMRELHRKKSILRSADMSYRHGPDT